MMKKLFYIVALALMQMSAYAMNDATTSKLDKLTVTVNGVPFTMVKVEAGTFNMGTKKSVAKYDKYWVPQHQVTLSQDYYIGVTEVTYAMWRAVMEGMDYESQKNTEWHYTLKNNLPVNSISYDNMMCFIHRLNQITGLTFRLPTEAEWEYAARGGKYSKGFKYSGGNKLDDVASGFREGVAQKKPNELGIYDMTGSVTEMCSDLDLSVFIGNDKSVQYPSESVVDPQGPSWTNINKHFKDGQYRYFIPHVLRGIVNFYSKEQMQVMVTDHMYEPSDREVGFRLVLEPSERLSQNLSFTANNLEAELEEMSVSVGDASFAMTRVIRGMQFMGTTTEKENRLHLIEISHDYYIAQTETTNELVCELNGTSSSYMKKPASFTSKESRDFIEKLNDKTGLSFRLPTEAEWEYAARGGQKSHGYSVAMNKYVKAEKAAYYSSSDSKQITSFAVAQKIPNELKLYDMSGNMWELCSDYYSPFGTENYLVDPKGPSQGTVQVVKGGSYSADIFRINVYTRMGMPLDKQYFDVGMRLVLPCKDDSQLPEIASSDLSVTSLDIPFHFIKVQGGTFNMGDYVGIGGGQPTTIKNDYYIGQTEVTQALWWLVMGSLPHGLPPVANAPIRNVSYDESLTFISKLNTMTGGHFRLPTSEEWEYAARGGNKSKGLWYAGSNFVNELKGEITDAVTSKIPNELGVYNMSGGVGEWTTGMKEGKHEIRGLSPIIGLSDYSELKTDVGLRLAMDDNSVYAQAILDKNNSSQIEKEKVANLPQKEEKIWVPIKTLKDVMEGCQFSPSAKVYGTKSGINYDIKYKPSLRFMLANKVEVNCFRFGDLEPEFHSGILTVINEDNQKVGFVDEEGRLNYEGFVWDYEMLRVPHFGGGKALAQRGNKWYIVGYSPYVSSNTPVQHSIVKATNFNEGGIAAVVLSIKGNSQGRQFAYMNTEGKLVFPQIWSKTTSVSGTMQDPIELGVFNEGLAKYYDRNKSLWGYIDTIGQVVIPAQFIDAGDFSEGLAVVQTKINGALKWVYVDHLGQRPISIEFSHRPGNFHSGYAPVKKANGKYNFINKDGKTMLHNDASYVTEFYSCGRALVEMTNIAADNDVLIIDENFETVAQFVVSSERLKPYDHDYAPREWHGLLYMPDERYFLSLKNGTKGRVIDGNLIEGRPMFGTEKPLYYTEISESGNSLNDLKKAFVDLEQGGVKFSFDKSEY